MKETPTMTSIIHLFSNHSTLVRRKGTVSTRQIGDLRALHAFSVAS